MGRAERRRAEKLQRKMEKKPPKLQEPTIKITESELMAMEKEVLQAAVQVTTKDLTEQFYYSLAYVLRRDELFGKKKIEKTVNSINEVWNDMTVHPEKIEEIKQSLKDEIKFELEIGSNIEEEPEGDDKPDVANTDDDTSTV